ncbi:MAG TPA: hypothetical protein VFO38_01625 [Candidatus Saccharimonadales bacterium]|nr:hypothetical protein [Candidatus Saccharimonadales bacterium]
MQNAYPHMKETGVQLVSVFVALPEGYENTKENRDALVWDLSMHMPALMSLIPRWRATLNGRDIEPSVADAINHDLSHYYRELSNIRVLAPDGSKVENLCLEFAAFDIQRRVVFVDVRSNLANAETIAHLMFSLDNLQTGRILQRGFMVKSDGKSAQELTAAQRAALILEMP